MELRDKLAKSVDKIHKYSSMRNQEAITNITIQNIWKTEQDPDSSNIFDNKKGSTGVTMATEELIMMNKDRYVHDFNNHSKDLKNKL